MSAAKSVSCFGSPPLAGIEYSCIEPDLPLRKYTVAPSLEKDGELTFQPSGVSRTGGAASRANRSSIHSEVLALLASKSTTRLANTSLRPSGESVGDEWRSSVARSRTSKPRAACASVGRASSRATGRRAWRRFMATPDIGISGMDLLRHPRAGGGSMDVVAEAQVHGLQPPRERRCYIGPGSTSPIAFD